MPSEAPTCPACGSTDVQEVKPDTYFCNYSESVFKYVDPSRLRVEHSPSFCWCGNPIQVQCQLCRREMCRQCDVAANRAAIYRSPGTRFRYRPDGYKMSFSGPGAKEDSFYYHSYIPRADKNALPVPVSGFGYLHRDMDRKIWGPFLYLSELLSTMAAAQGLHYKPDTVPAEHLCYACVAAAVPATAGRIANREICESPGCAAQPSKTCGCCGGLFCVNDVTPRLYHISFGGKYENGRDHPRYLFRRIFCILAPYMDGGGWSVGFPRPEGWCLPCLGEAIDKVSGPAMQIFEQEDQLHFSPYSPRPSLHKQDLGQPDWSIASCTWPEQITVRKRRTEISPQRESYAKELLGRMRERMQDYVKSLPCQLREAFRDEKYYATYMILDERDRTAPAALPEPTETRG